VHPVEELQVEQVPAKKKTDFTFDPRGFFVIFLDKEKKEIVVEHYLNVSKEDSKFQVATGKLNKVIRGDSALSIRDTIIELGLVSLMDHIGYLGIELGKAETALKMGLNYEQDGPLGQD
jgi:tetrahydromethanopterin S-methyltransferase subunit A